MRRRGDHHVAGIDWHHPQWLAVEMLVLVLCCIDIVLTLVLVSHGATEVNSLMRPLVSGPVQEFIYWKFSLTAACVICLILLARALGVTSIAALLPD